MMPGYNDLVAPNQFAPAGDILQQMISRQDAEAQRSMAAQLQEQNRLQAQQQQNRFFNLREIDQDTSATQFKPINAEIDEITARTLKGIQSKALQNYVHLDPQEMKYRLSKDMEGFTRWHSAAKGTASQLEEQFNLFKQQNKNIPPQQAYGYVKENFLKDFIDPQTGSYKDPTLIQPRDYISELNSPEVISQFDVDITPFSEVIGKYDLIPKGASDYTNNKGQVRKYKYDAKVSPFQQLKTDKDGKPVGIEFKSEKIVSGKDPQGNDITWELMPQDLFDEISSNPEARNALNFAYGKFKEAKGLKGLDPQTDNAIKRKFALDWTKKLDASYFKTEEVEKTPPPRITVNVGSGNKNAAPTWVNNMSAAIASKNPQKIKDVASHLLGGGKYSDIEVDGSGNIIVTYDAPFRDPTSGQTVTIQKKESIANDKYLKQRLAGLYKKMMGDDSNLEKTEFYQQSGGESQVPDFLKKTN